MTSNPLDLDAIQARLDAATKGPWGTYRDLAGVYTIQARPRTTIRHGHEHDGDIATLAASRSDAESYTNAHFITRAPQDVAALVAEVRRLRAELAAERERYTAGLRKVDEHVNAMSEELKRYADGEEQPVLWSVYNAMHSRAATAEGRVAELETVMREIRHLHKDSPMGPCPVCIDADAIAEGRDGLMPYPCPTGRLAGAQDCEPAAPVVRSAD